MLDFPISISDNSKGFMLPLSSPSKVVTLKQFVREISSHVSGWVFEIDVMLVIFLNENGNHLRVLKEVECESIDFHTHKEILRRRHLKVYSIIGSLYRRYDCLKMGLEFGPSHLGILT